MNNKTKKPESLSLADPVNRFKEAVIVPNGKIKSLPLEGFLDNWEAFEEFVKNIARIEFGHKKNVFRYGSRGQAQHGIDIILFDSKGSSCTVIQCKYVKNIKRGEITRWVNSFLEGKFSKEADRFILCTSFIMESNTHLIEEWKNATFDLSNHQVDAELWDGGKLQQLLRDKNEVVSQFFGENTAERYCIKMLPLDHGYPSNYRKKHINNSSNMLTLENNTARLECFLPSTDSMRTNSSALISFARSNLNGISFVLEEEQFVSWMRWSDYFDIADEREYATKYINDSKWLFQSNSAQLMLHDNERVDFDWILSEAWKRYKKGMISKEASWKTLRFPKIVKHNESVHALINVDRSLWNLMINFCREHDVSKGNSEWHIFDSAPAVIKVYSPEKTLQIDAGYHLILYAYNNNEGIALPWEEGLTLGWSPMSIESGNPNDYSPRKFWDAEYTHDWLITKFIPKVIDWYVAKNNRFPPFSIFTRKNKSINKINVSNRFGSLARSTYRTIDETPNTLESLTKLASELQRHFNGSAIGLPVNDVLIKNTLTFLATVIPFSKPLDEYYIRSKLDIPKELTISDGLQKLIAKDPKLHSRFELDLCLRCLAITLEDSKSIPTEKIRQGFNKLKPVWEFSREDLLVSF